MGGRWGAGGAGWEVAAVVAGAGAGGGADGCRSRFTMILRIPFLFWL